jgi:hypothetical protein
MTYAEAPFILRSREIRWSIRQREVGIVRMEFAQPAQGEYFYLGMLLNIVKAPKGYKHFRTVRHVQEAFFPASKETCIAKKLLSDNAE